MKGNVEQRGKISWRLTAYLGYDPNTGAQKRERKTVKAENKRQAEKMLREWIGEIEKGVKPRGNNMTVRQFADEWLEKHCEANLQPKTVHTYREKLDGHILPVLGHVKLCELVPKMIVDFCDDLRQANRRKDCRDVAEKKLSDRTILHCYRILSSMLQVAVYWQVLSENPAKKVKPPKVERKKALLYDEAVVEQICRAIKQEPPQYQAMVVLEVYTGMRIGELLGMTWKHVNFEECSLDVRKAAQYIPGKGTFIKNTPKNSSSERTIEIDRKIIELLKRHQQEQAKSKVELVDCWEENDLVFTKWNGKPFLPNVLSNWFPAFMLRHNLPRLRFHDLRHYHVSFLVHMGIPIHDIQRRTGHAKASTLLDVYGHARKSSNDRITRTLTAAIAPHLQ